MFPFGGVNDAYRESLSDIRANGHFIPSSSDPKSPGSAFGAKQRITKEIMGYQFSVRDPRDRLVNLPGRRTNPIFAVANALWMLAGRDDLEFIQYYNQRGKDFSDDGVTLYGAHGARLFKSGGI